MDNFEKAKSACVGAMHGLDIKEKERIVLECKTTWCYEFAKYISGSDIKAHEQVILELKDSYYCYLFARDVLGANVEEHFKVILTSGDKYYLDRFIEEVDYKNTKVEEWLFYI